MTRDDLLKIHGNENCHVCGNPKVDRGALHCSYPHGMVPDKEISEAMMTWKMPEQPNDNQ